MDKKQMAEILGVSIKTIDKWVCQRLIPYVKLNSAVRFNPKEVDAYISAKRTITPKRF